MGTSNMRRVTRLINTRSLVGASAVVATAIGLRPAQAHPGHEGDKNQGHILFAVPKKGRLHQKIVDLLKGAGFDYVRPDRLDVAECLDIPMSFVFLPAADIATYVGKGNVHLGITGEDIVAESDVDVE